MTKTVLIPLGEGFELVEACATIDVLNRCGCEVTLASVGSDRTVKSQSVAAIVCQTTIKDVSSSKKTFDCIALPGGMGGAKACSECGELITMLKEQKAAKRLIGAICAAPPVVLSKHNLLDDVKEYCCYPGMDDKAHPAQPKRVCYDNNVVTSIGPGTALDFGLKLGAVLVGEEKAKQVRDALKLDY